MSKRFDKYRMSDGKTRLGQGYFNEVFKDVDNRIHALEELKMDWTETIRQLSQLGQARINELIGAQIATIEAAQQELARLVDLMATIVFEEDLRTAIEQIIALINQVDDADNQAREVLLQQITAHQQSITEIQQILSTKADKTEVSKANALIYAGLVL